MESKLLIEGGPVGDFSEQLCLDCVSSGSCKEGYVSDCLQYIAQHGVPSEDSYPYEGKKGQCQQAGKAVAAQIASPGFARIESESRDALRQVRMEAFCKLPSQAVCALSCKWGAVALGRRAPLVDDRSGCSSLCRLW